MSSITIQQVADLAQVSVATVDRVLHERPGVSARSRQRVKEAIHELGFGRLPDRLSRATRGRLRFLILLPKLDTGFVQQMERDLRRAQGVVPDVDLLVEIKRINLTDGDEIIAALQDVRPGRFQGVGLFAFDAPGVRDAIDATVERGVPVVTLVSDVPSSRRSGFVGIDNIAAGRTAGRLMGKFLRAETGPVGIIIGNQHIRDHMERLIGFRQILSRDYANLLVLPEIEGNSIAHENSKIVQRLLTQSPGLKGIYNIGGGASGVISALASRAPGCRPLLIVHELTDKTRAGLNAGVVDGVIAQTTGHMARSTLRLLTATSLGDEPNWAQEKIGIDIFLAENLT